MLEADDPRGLRFVLSTTTGIQYGARIKLKKGLVADGRKSVTTSRDDSDAVSGSRWDGSSRRHASLSPYVDSLSSKVESGGDLVADNGVGTGDPTDRLDMQRASLSNPKASGHRRLGRNQEAYDRFSQIVELPFMVVTVLWVPVLLVPLVRPLHGSVAFTFAVIDYMVWALFALEYVVKLYLAPSRWRFVRTHVLDLLTVVVPFFRPVRLGRLARLGRLGRVGIVAGRAIDRGKSVMTHRGLHFVLLAVGIIVFACAGIVTIAERNASGSNIHNLGQGLWWAMVTVATVGYGDKYPVTPLGQGLAVFLMLAGIGLIGLLTATFASYFVGQQVDKSQAEREELRQELAAAKVDRDRLAATLDRLSGQMDELLRRSSGDNLRLVAERPNGRRAKL
jgi:voltage-gated potassium channel